jgi:hypothetical protein
MALHPTASESNLKSSLKKYFIDAIQVGEGIPITFDKGLTAPVIQGLSATEWVSFVFGPRILDTVTDFALDIYCCTKEDEEGYRLAQIVDIVMGYLVDEDGYMVHIPFYNTNVDPWVQIGALMPIRQRDQDPVPPLADQTKARHLAVTIKYPAKF